MGKISRVYGWDDDGDQLFLTITPLADEISLYRTHSSLQSEKDDIIPSQTRKGFTELKCIDYSPIEAGLVAAGQQDGLVKLFNILEPQSASLDIKQNRTVIDLAFSAQGLLAVGLEKGKSEAGLKIYNINHYDKYSNQELQQTTFTFIPNETVVWSTFYNETNLLVGSPKFLRDIDIRTLNPAFQVPSKTIYGITQDPFNQFNFSAFAEDGTVSIYDRRQLSNTSPDPVLSFNKLMGDTTRRNNNSCFRYSPKRRGEFATSHFGEVIRRWQTDFTPSNNKSDSLFVEFVSDVKTKYDRVISFDYSSDIGYSNSLDFICMRKSGSVFKMPVIESQRSLHFNSFNDLLFTGPSGTIIEEVDKLPSLADLKIEDENGELQDFDEYYTGSEKNNGTISVEEESLTEEQLNEFGFHHYSDILENDISVRMRRRAFMGYGTNCIKNMEIIDALKTMDNGLFLKSTWRWLDIAQSSISAGGIGPNELDLSYEGVLGIWKGVENLQEQDRFGNLKITQEIFEKKIAETLASRRSNPAPIIETKKLSQRKLCLALVGFYFTPTELEQFYSKMIKNGQYSKAAAWAIFVGDVTRAVDILSSTKSNKFMLIATAISGYLVQKRSSVNNIWKVQCRKMAEEFDDPYLKCIFTYIADNNWWDILGDSSLSLRERIGVALRCLPDEALTKHLDGIAQSYITKGELEGLVLTGITPAGMDLLQSYVNRTTDIQTAAIISSFACPKYFKDERAEQWIDCYRSLLNSWGMFGVRAQFDVARARQLRGSTNKVSVVPKCSQIILQCSRCNKSIAKPDKPAKRTVQVGGKVTSKSSSSCPHCGAPLPKCAICLLPLGKPLPRDVTESQKTAAKQGEFKEWPSFCLTCNHGMHSGHAEEWFSKSNVCPVPGCLCHCNNK